uniref:lipopolysaccharide kinase InaA family protein n=1 Tax=Thiolapillus sp. TaxID=2017437 RepID=UPI003AF9562D
AEKQRLIARVAAMTRRLHQNGINHRDLYICHFLLRQPWDGQACLRPRDRFWDIPVPKIDSAFDNLFVPQPSWSPSTTQQLRKLVAAPYLPPNDWTPRSEAYFVFPLAQGTPGKQCGLAATGVYQPSLRSPWLAAAEETLHLHLIDLHRVQLRRRVPRRWRVKDVGSLYFSAMET